MDRAIKIFLAVFGGVLTLALMLSIYYVLIPSFSENLEPVKIVDVEIRLDNLQVVNTFNDGDWQFVRNWLRRNDRDMAVLAWDLLNERRVNGLGEVVAIHQHGHAERRKSKCDFTVHEVYNDRVDALTHELDDSMPLYVSFQRKLTGRTVLWYEPLEEEGVGHEALHEVVNDSYKHITRSSQRRMSIQRIRNKDGWFHATFMKGSAGRSRSERLTPLITKIMHEHLPTDTSKIRYQ